MAKIAVKPFWKSTTLWINFAGLLTIVLDIVVKSNIIPDADVIAIIVAILNILNRFRGVEVKKLTL